ncbi:MULTISPECIES: helix-turn-helix domain-containing protein [unclassified Pseudonocardia]|jgi:AcrR family transcriptional regulator/DNA-binding XRE family transcriptional regulator|uniref:helix-turn-helix domain-containing protein n=1 Tax=unclassified Pseudonocardia TaxID=2619320 RepID=UPI0009634C87|nr:MULTISPECIES: helix-turn-helix domain-containing protein [unclassified Pseudonocardia]MBN9096519.1 helix-turn-helix domain-containing protein [Pseudonocardia sp.]OJY48103.1 MAG: TetR family transcriptional regulator [Pseudonocardia sp. 73-21]
MSLTASEAVLGAQVRLARTSKGLSLRALARMIDVSPATLSQIENARTGLTVARLSRIADVLGLTVSEVLDIAPTAAPEGLPPPRRLSPPEDWRHYAPIDFDPVLRAALEEFLAIGYHGATVRGIAARCGLSVSGIYHYYTSKQQMLVTILDLTMTDLLARARSAQAEGRDPVERFSLLVENLVLYHTHRRELGAVGASEMRSFDAENRPRIAEQRTQQQRMVDREVEGAVQLGRFRSDHPREAARAVVTMCTALPTWWRPDGPLSPEQVAEQYVGIALDMMRLRR